MATTLSKTQRSTLQKRAAHNGVLLWEDGGWRYPDGIISDAPQCVCDTVTVGERMRA